MESMFNGAKLFNQPINNLNVSYVKRMNSMFYAAVSFNQQLNGWSMGSVNDTSSMFYHAKNFNQPLNNWNVSNIDNMSNMFKFAIFFNQPLDKWDVSNVTNMSDILYNAISFKQDISAWKFNIKCFKPKIAGLDFEEHNIKYKFNKNKLLDIIDIIKNSNNDQEKYHANIYIKQFKEFDLDNFSSIINELKTKSNYDKEFFDDFKAVSSLLK
jgi:surface protein